MFLADLFNRGISYFQDFHEQNQDDDKRLSGDLDMRDNERMIGAMMRGNTSRSIIPKQDVKVMSMRKSVRNVNRNFMTQMRTRSTMRQNNVEVNPKRDVQEDFIEIKMPSYEPPKVVRQPREEEGMKIIEESLNKYEYDVDKAVKKYEDVRSFNTINREDIFMNIPIEISGVVSQDVYNHCLGIYLNNQSVAKARFRQKSSISLLSDVYNMELWFCMIIEPKPDSPHDIKEWKKREKMKITNFTSDRDSNIYRGFFHSDDCDDEILNIFCEGNIQGNPTIRGIVQDNYDNAKVHDAIMDYHYAIGIRYDADFFF